MYTAKIIQEGNGQLVQLPEGYDFEGTEVLILRVGRAVLLLPTEDQWEGFWRSLDSFPEDFMVDRDQLGVQDR